MNEYQSYGSGVTYYRRYALSSMLGLVTDKDTDAAGAPVAQSSKIYSNKEIEQKESQVDWSKKINNCNTLTELSNLFIENESSIAGNQTILNLLTTRKQQITK